MREALLPLGATAFLAFLVHRWAADELGRERRLSPGAANAVVVLLLLHGMIVFLAAAGRVVPVDLPAAVGLAIGVSLLLAGAALIVTAVRALGARDRILGVTFDRVVSTGPFARSRHPLYVGWAAMLIGAGLAGRSALALALAGVMTVALVLLARAEERLMMEHLVDDYAAYRTRTPAVPGWTSPRAREAPSA